MGKQQTDEASCNECPPPEKPQCQFIHATILLSDSYPPCHLLFLSHFLLFGQTAAIQLHCYSCEPCHTLSFIYIDTENITLQK